MEAEAVTASALRRYTLKLYPNATQARAMEARRLAHQELYNAALQQRIEAWQRQRRTVTLYDQQKEVPALRREIEALAPIGVTELRGTLARVDRAMRAFMQRARQGAGRSSGFPRFQPAWRYPGWSYEDKGGWSLTWRDGKRADLRIMGLGTIKARGNPPHRGEVRACTVMYRDGAWWASIVMDCPARRACGTHALTVRFDLVTSFAAVETAVEGAVHAPAARPNLPVIAGENAAVTTGCVQTGCGQPANAGGLEQHDDAAVSELQRAMARCKRGSHRYRELRRRKQRIQTTEARRRAWALHNWTTAIVTSAQRLTVIAPPSIRDATSTARGSAKRPGAAVAFKAAFNRTVLSFAPAEAIAQLMYKADEAGVHLDVIDDPNAPARIGNDIVRAAKAARSLARKARRQQKETTP